MRNALYVIYCLGVERPFMLVLRVTHPERMRLFVRTVRVSWQHGEYAEYGMDLL